MGSLRLLLSLETRCARVRVHWPLPNLLVLRILVPSRPKLSDPENTRLNAIEGTSGERAARPGPRLDSSNVEAARERSSVPLRSASKSRASLLRAHTSHGTWFASPSVRCPVCRVRHTRESRESTEQRRETAAAPDARHVVSAQGLE